MKQQTNQLENVDKGLDDIESNIKRANKQLRAFVRRMATDKIIIVLFLLVLCGIIAAIVIPIVKKKTPQFQIPSATV